MIHSCEDPPSIPLSLKLAFVVPRRWISCVNSEFTAAILTEEKQRYAFAPYPSPHGVGVATNSIQIV